MTITPEMPNEDVNLLALMRETLSEALKQPNRPNKVIGYVTEAIKEMEEKVTTKEIK